MPSDIKILNEAYIIAKKSLDQNDGLTGIIETYLGFHKNNVNMIENGVKKIEKNYGKNNIDYI